MARLYSSPPSGLWRGIRISRGRPRVQTGCQFHKAHRKQPSPRNKTHISYVYLQYISLLIPKNLLQNFLGILLEVFKPQKLTGFLSFWKVGLSVPCSRKKPLSLSWCTALSARSFTSIAAPLKASGNSRTTGEPLKDRQHSRAPNENVHHLPTIHFSGAIS